MWILRAYSLQLESNRDSVDEEAVKITDNLIRSISSEGELSTDYRFSTRMIRRSFASVESLEARGD